MVEDYEEIQDAIEEDQLEEQTEKQKEAQDEVYEDTAPTYKEKDDLYSLFKWIIARTDSSKVGNLDKVELGLLNISVRDCQRISLIGDVLKHAQFGKFFLGQGEITLATSLSKKGHLVELFVTTQKKSAKLREM